MVRMDGRVADRQVKVVVRLCQHPDVSCPGAQEVESGTVPLGAARVLDVPGADPEIAHRCSPITLASLAHDICHDALRVAPRDFFARSVSRAPAPNRGGLTRWNPLLARQGGAGVASGWGLALRGPNEGYCRWMGLDDAAAAYDLFTGRFSGALARKFVDVVDPTPGQRLLDVGCGPGALTRLLVDRVGASAVAAVDPSDVFVEAARARLPGVDVRRAGAEDLPYADGTFDAALAQLVVHFMVDPVAGLREMARVTRRGGVVAACVWDNSGGAGPLSPLWRAAQELDPGVRDESGGAGAREGHLAELAREAGLVRAESTRLTVEVEFETFQEWWEPLALGVGSGGTYVKGLEKSHREALRARLENLFGPDRFRAFAVAWCVRAEAVPGA
jgi:SAM-dependent methyltransferase